MYLRRIAASALTACALAGVGAVVAPAAEAATPITCSAYHGIVSRTHATIAAAQRRHDFRTAAYYNARLAQFVVTHRTCIQPGPKLHPVVAHP